MSEIGKLRQAVEIAAKGWPPFHDGDSNLVDVYWLAQKIREVLGVVLPSELPPKNEGVLAFECVEANLLSDPQNRVLRDISVADVGQRIVNLAGAVNGMLLFSGDQNLVVSLYAWHGCIHMGKLLSCVYNIPRGQALYTPQMRRDGYEHIRGDWEREEAQGNPWVRYGVSLTRPMERGRRKQDFDFEVHENWIPKDSPYWEP
jgi:hypothetical protein